MSKNDLNEVLTNATKIPTAEDLLPKSKKRKGHTLISAATRKKPKKKVKETVPSGFPEGTILNDDKTLTLPDGRVIRKIKQG